MSPRKTSSLWQSLSRADLDGRRALWSGDTEISLSALTIGSTLGGRLQELRGRSVLVSTRDQVAAAIALIEIDGIARRLVLCPPDLDPAHLPYAVATAEIDAVVTDRPLDNMTGLGVECVVPCQPAIQHTPVHRTSHSDTEWVLFTSGTTGVPKMVVHTLASLTGAIKPT